MHQGFCDNYHAYTKVTTFGRSQLCMKCHDDYPDLGRDEY